MTFPSCLIQQWVRRGHGERSKRSKTLISMTMTGAVFQDSHGITSLHCLSSAIFSECCDGSSGCSCSLFKLYQLQLFTFTKVIICLRENNSAGVQIRSESSGVIIVKRTGNFKSCLKVKNNPKQPGNK